MVAITKPFFETRIAARTKPHITQIIPHLWLCVGSGKSASGHSPSCAYANWMTRS